MVRNGAAEGIAMLCQCLRRLVCRSMPTASNDTIFQGKSDRLLPGTDASRRHLKVLFLWKVARLKTPNISSEALRCSGKLRRDNQLILAFHRQLQRLSNTNQLIFGQRSRACSFRLRTDRVINSRDAFQASGPGNIVNSSFPLLTELQKVMAEFVERAA